MVTTATSSEFDYKIYVKLPRNKPRFLQISSELDSIWRNCNTKDARGEDQAADVGNGFDFNATLRYAFTLLYCINSDFDWSRITRSLK